MFFLFALAFNHKIRHNRYSIRGANSIPSSGTATFLTTVRVRAQPSTSSETVATYSKGEKVTYDQVVTGDSRTWISYIASSGNRRYCCAIDSDGSVYVSVDGTTPTPTGTPDPPDVFGGKTGMKYIPTQGSFDQAAIRKSGCCFLAACVRGGCTTQAQCVTVWTWATAQGYVRSSDAYVSCGASTLAKHVSDKYGYTLHTDYIITQNCKKTHFYILKNGVELFNSAGLGYAVC